MKSRALPVLLSLATSLMLAPLANAAGMIVIDPIQGGIPVMRPMTVRPGTRPGTVAPRPVPILKGQVSFGLRLESADVKVDINDQVAKTYITQTFFNDTDRNLAGTYLFPLPDDTTFSSFSLHIDGKPVEGKILEANEARQQYEAIVRQMVDPGLLEYADYKTVRARIFPIPAHGSKKVELEYTQVLKAENGLIKYNFPLKTEGESAPAEEIKINVKLASAQGLRTIWSPSHIISARRDGDHKAIASYTGKDIVPDKDFLLYYSVSDKDMSANLLTHRESGEDGYFLMTVTPPVKAKEVVNKDIVFVADISGSMKGERMDQNKKALKYLVNALNPGDRFSIVQFNTDVDPFKPNLLAATPENKKAALSFIEDMEAAGGTNIGDALKTAGSMLGSAKDRPAYLVLMTDGEPTVGETSTPGLLKVIDPKKDIRLFDFGIGYDVNTKLLNKLAEDNHGTSQYVEPEESLEVAMSSFYDKIKSPVLSNVKLSFDGVQVKDMYPRNVKDIFAGSQLLLLGKYKGSGNGTCHMTGTVNGVARAYSFPLKFEEQALSHGYLPRLWAMRRIAHLTEVAQNNGEAREVIDEIIALSKKYGMITNYTSFLVTDPNENRRMQPTMPGVPMRLPAARPRAMRASGGGGGGLGMPPTAMGKFVRSPGDAVAMARPTWSASPREMRIIDDRPTVRDFRSAPPPPMPHLAMAPSAMPSTLPSTRLDGFVGPRAGSMAYGDEGGSAESDISMSWRYEAKAEETGKGAVVRAKLLNKLKDSVAVEQEKAGSPSVKTVDSKTFYLRNGFWTDSTYDQAKSPKAQEITFGTKEYFDLLKNVPGISKYLSVGRQVIVVHQGHTYKVSYKQEA
jgi:Ca-activated chloride channel homolog